MNPSPLSLYFYFYELLPFGELNAKCSHACRPGVLLRSSNEGIACLQPWPELGDHSLREELNALRAGTPLPLGCRALDCISVDGTARREVRSLFSPEVSIPLNHASLRHGISDEDLLALDSSGFTIGKYKASRNLNKVLEDISRYVNLLPHWSWRVDFNGTLTKEEFPEVARKLLEITGGKISFFEDPTPFDESQWCQWHEEGIPIAADWLPNDYEPSSPLPIKVWKPALERFSAELANQWVVTSYMDHPIGQCWAAYESSRLLLSGANVSACGLVTQGLYHANAFSEQLGEVRPEFTPPPGTGLGFDELIHAIPWKKLQ